MTNRDPQMTTQPVSVDPALDKRLRRHVIGRIRDYYVITVPGAEALCHRELLSLGLDSNTTRTERGGVAFRARFVDCQRANLNLRTATRVLMRMETFPATNLRRLAKNADRIAWELFFSTAKGLSVKVKSHRSRLYHTGAIAQTLESGIVRRLSQTGRPAPPFTVPQTLYVRVVDDQVALSVDSSGASLYKRGFKSGPAHAPIRETLAAVILLSAGYDGLMPLVDPMCGSGTFSMEAAMMAKQMAPGIGRGFAFMGWPAYTEKKWAFLKREAEARINILDRPRIFASDVDPTTCAHLSATTDQNGLADAVTVSQKDFFHSRADQYGSTPGLVTINPPYGIRLGSQHQADDLFMAICRHLKAYYRGWRIALVTPNRELARRVPFPARQMPLFHGGLTLSLVIGSI